METSQAPFEQQSVGDGGRQRWSTAKTHLAEARRARRRAQSAFLYHLIRYFTASAYLPPWIASLAIGSVTALALSLVVIGAGLDGPFLLLACCFVGYAFAGVGTFLMLADLPGENDGNRMDERRRLLSLARGGLSAPAHRVTQLKAELSLQKREIDALLRTARSKVVEAAEAARRAAEDRAAAANARLSAATAQLNAIQNAADLETAELLAIEPGRLYPDEFELFVVRVFAHLGYNAKQTGKTGDQGVDILAEKVGFRIAIQAKCYKNSVGNSAVQEVFAGMMHYQCNRCVVVTTDYFTSSATALAHSTGCILIDRDSIPELIRGEFTL